MLRSISLALLFLVATSLLALGAPILREDGALLDGRDILYEDELARDHVEHARYAPWVSIAYPGSKAHSMDDHVYLFIGVIPCPHQSNDALQQSLVPVRLPRSFDEEIENVSDAMTRGRASDDV